MTEMSRRTFMAGAGQLSVLALVPLAAGCATTAGGGSGRQGNAAEAVNRAWAADNRAIRTAHGSRIVQATPDQAYRAARAAMERLDLQIDEASSAAPNVTARRFFQQGGWSATPAFQAAEQARLRTLLGKRANKAMIERPEEMLTGTVRISTALKGTVRIDSDFTSFSATSCPAKRICFSEIPPAALRSVYFEYWTGFTEELIEILAEDGQARADAEARRRRAAPRKATPRARPKPKAKPPSGWKLPPSGWKPPPRSN